MTPLVCGDDVQTRREAEPDSADERIREAHSREIDDGVRLQFLLSSCARMTWMVDSSQAG